MSAFEAKNLVRAAARGDRRAAEELLRRLLPRVRNLVRYLVRGDEEVDDISQLAAMAILQGLPTYRGDAPVERWADRIVARETFRHLRRVRLRAAREQAVEDPALLDPQQAHVPDDRYLLRRALVRKLDQLPEAQRVALALHHAAGFTVPEIASLMEVSPDTIKSRLRLGIAQLRKDALDAKKAEVS